MNCHLPHRISNQESGIVCANPLELSYIQRLNDAYYHSRWKGRSLKSIWDIPAAGPVLAVSPTSVLRRSEALYESG